MYVDKNSTSNNDGLVEPVVMYRIWYINAPVAADEWFSTTSIHKSARNNRWMSATSNNSNRKREFTRLSRLATAANRTNDA